MWSTKQNGPFQGHTNFSKSYLRLQCITETVLLCLGYSRVISLSKTVSILLRAKCFYDLKMRTDCMVYENPLWLRTCCYSMLANNNNLWHKKGVKDWSRSFYYNHQFHTVPICNKDFTITLHSRSCQWSELCLHNLYQFEI